MKNISVMRKYKDNAARKKLFQLLRGEMQNLWAVFGCWCKRRFRVYHPVVGRRAL